MQVAVMHVSDVPVVLDRHVAATGAVLMLVALYFRTGRHVITPSRKPVLTERMMPPKLYEALSRCQRPGKSPMREHFPS
jgi:hypothetical protein